MPVHKKGSITDPVNYRPISLTSSACKVLEAIVKDRILEHLNANNLLSPQQFGFLTKRSTCTQLLECTRDWNKSVASKTQTDIIYLDFAKAFDSVTFSKLIIKLEYYGITGLTLLWIKDFLHLRKQQVKVGNSLSSNVAVTSGVPQGSVLGPILFLVYINDLHIEASSVSVKIFADDVKTYTTISNLNSHCSLQSCIDKIAAWGDAWQLTLSPTKCAVLSIGPTLIPPMYKINGVSIPIVENFLDLGVKIDQNLNFESHISDICSKARQRSALILKCFQSRDKKLLINAFITSTVAGICFLCLVALQLDCKEKVRVSSTSVYKDVGGAKKC